MINNLFCNLLTFISFSHLNNKYNNFVTVKPALKYELGLVHSRAHAPGSFDWPMKLFDYNKVSACPITPNCPITLFDNNFASKLDENSEVYKPITFEEILIVMTKSFCH